MEEYIATFIFFFAVIDPIGTVPVYISITKSFDAKTKRHIAIKATFVSAMVLIFFVMAGELILSAIDIPLSAFQIAGGIVLFLFALTMIFGESKPEEEINMSSKANDTAIFPLAMPSIASPGAMLAAVMMTENNSNSIFQQFETTVIMLIVLLIVLLLMLGATFIHRFIGHGGASIISRVMGIILSSVAISNVLEGVKTYFNL